MANIKFSQFSQSTDVANVDFVVGYDGATNVRISPADLVATAGPFLPLTGGTMTGDVILNNNEKLKLGTSPKTSMYNDGTDTYIQQTAGDLYLFQSADNKDIIFASDNGSGGVENYIQIDGSEGRTTFNKNIRLNDNVQAQFGGSADLQIYHNSSNDRGYIYNATGDLYIENDATDSDIKFFSDNGSGGTTEYFRVDGGIASLVASKDLLMAIDGDGGKIKFGASQDLQIYHDGSNSFIDETGTGSLFVRADDSIEFKSYTADESLARFISNDRIELYFNGAKKFETTSTGVAIDSTSDTTLRLQAKNPTAFNDPILEFVTHNEASGASSGKIQLTNGAFNSNDMAFFTETNNSVTEKMRIFSNGSITFNSYDASNNTGTATFLLGTDANGNVVKTTTVPSGSGGPFLPLAGGTMTGAIDMSSNSAILLDNSNNNNQFYIRNGGTSSATFQIGTGSPGSNIKLTLNGAGDATFTEDVTIGSAGAASDKTLNILTGGTKSSVKLMEAGTVYGFSTLYDGATNKFHINRHSNSATGTPVLSLNRDDDNAVFAGNVSVPGGKYLEAVHTDSTYARLKGNGLFFNRSNVFIAAEADNFASLNIGYPAVRWGNVEINAANTKFLNGANEVMRVASSGNVGIGTTSPTDTLTISNDNNLLLGLDSPAANDAQLRFYSAGSYKNIIYRPANSNDLRFHTTTSGDVLTIQQNGNIGIGTTSPGRVLDVKSSGGDQGIALVQSGSDVRIFQAIQTGTGDGAILLTRADGSDQSLIRGQGDSSLNGGDLKLGTASAGLVLKSANGTQYKITVANDGTVTSTAV